MRARGRSREGKRDRGRKRAMEREKSDREERDRGRKRAMEREKSEREGVRQRKKVLTGKRGHWRESFLLLW